MAYLGSYNCSDVIFDIYDSERIPVNKTKNEHYVTPKRLIKIEVWMIKNNIYKIDSIDIVNTLIKENMIGTYADGKH